MRGPYRFEIAVHDVTFRVEDGIGILFPVFLAVEELTKHVYAEVADGSPENAAAFLARLVAQFAERIVAVTTEVRPAFTDWRAGFNENMAAVGPHPFAVACRARNIIHARSLPPFTKPLPLKVGSPVEIR